MKSGRFQFPAIAGIIVVLALASFSGSAVAYDRYSVADDDTNCGACHGDFRSNLYISLSDGMVWGNLHNIHRTDMLNGDCEVCHSPGDRFPVFLSSSTGGDGLDPIGCVGCHGRAEDHTVENPDWPMSGYGAGLRQHHHNAGVSVCADCHLDADPVNFTTASERTLPTYYASPGNGHPAMPTDPCNQDGSEDFAGATVGQDNDGDLLYDGDDSDCSTDAVPDAAMFTGLLVQNHPNPFKPETVIQYTLTDPGPVQLRVYSIAGELVRTLVDEYHDGADTYAVSWDGVDDFGRTVASGIYLARLESGGRVETKRMVLAQ